MIYKCKIYAVRDSHGNTWAECVDEPGNTVQVYGIHDKNGEYLLFESDAFHLGLWCKENGLELVIQDVEVTINF